MTLRYPLTIETRLTYDHGHPVGMHTNQPLGLFTTVGLQGLIVRIEFAREPINLRVGFRGDSWASVERGDGQPMTKFLMRPHICADFFTHEWWWCDRRYILEYRIANMPD